MNLFKWFKKKMHPSSMELQETPTGIEQSESIQYIDLGLTSGSLWADRNAGAETIYRLGVTCPKASAPGKLPTYDQCAELINECDFSSVLIQDENNIMKNFIKAQGPNGNSIFFPCVRLNLIPDEMGIGAYCWCDKEMNGDYSCFLMLQEKLLGVLNLAEITNLTIGLTLKSGSLMVRNVK